MQWLYRPSSLSSLAFVPSLSGFSSSTFPAKHIAQQVKLVFIKEEPFREMGFQVVVGFKG